MKRHFCDRCGNGMESPGDHKRVEEITDDKPDEIAVVVAVVHRISVGARGTPKMVDLCDQCVTDLARKFVGIRDQRSADAWQEIGRTDDDLPVMARPIK